VRPFCSPPDAGPLGGGYAERMRLLRCAGLSVALAFVGAVACSTSDGRPTCAQRVSDAQNAVATAEAQAGTNLSCHSDSDCVLASNTTGCWIACGILENQAGATQLATVIAQINATTCANFTADGCPEPIAPPCGVLPSFCIGGQCTDNPFADAGGFVCALYSGEIAPSDEQDAGPFEVCTSAYPTCTTYLESPGFECCNVENLGNGGTDDICMPNDSGAYSPNLPPPLPDAQ
jgi:hypothetical protein